MNVNCKPRGMHTQCIEFLISFMYKAVQTAFTIITIMKSVITYIFG